jgi:hypothetical protein
VRCHVGCAADVQTAALRTKESDLILRLSLVVANRCEESGSRRSHCERSGRRSLLDLRSLLAIASAELTRHIATAAAATTAHACGMRATGLLVLETLRTVKDRAEKCLNTVDYLSSTKRKELSIYEGELKVETELDALLPKAAIWL